MTPPDLEPTGSEQEPPAPPAQSNVTVTLVLALGLALTLVLLSSAVLIGIVKGQRELSEMGTRALSVAIAATAGALGYQAGRARDSAT